MRIPMTSPRILERPVNLFPWKTALHCGDHAFSYADFKGRVDRLSHALAELGVRKGDRVAYLSYNCHRLLEGYFGVTQMGAILLPLNIRLTAHDFELILNHARPRVLIVHPDFLQSIRGIQPNLQSIEHCVLLAPDVSSEWPQYDQLLEQANTTPYPVPAMDEDDVAELFYTSGTTARPKGVMLTHRNLYSLALQMVGALKLDEPEVFLHSLPLYHANGWSGPHCMTFVGATHAIIPRFNPTHVCKAIAEWRATLAYMVPTMVIELLNAPALDLFELSSMRRLIVGGSAPSPAMVREVEERLGWEFITAYGLTETSPVATFSFLRSWHRDLPAAERYRTKALTGQPMPGVECRVVDHNGNEVPHDGKTSGELLIRSDTVMRGYWNDPEATQEAIRDGWFHSGDIATIDEQNYLQIVDRKKDIIISGGENISSIEVENVLYEHPAVQECVVIAIPDAKWGERPLALVVLKPGAQVSGAALVAWCREHLAHYKAPDRVEFRENLPKTGTGKLQKNVLREPYWQGQTRRIH